MPDDAAVFFRQFALRQMGSIAQALAESFRGFAKSKVGERNHPGPVERHPCLCATAEKLRQWQRAVF